MQTYAIIKSIVMALALAGAFGFFFVRATRLYRLMRSVEGQSDFSLDRLGERVRVLFTDVLGQSNVRRKPLIGTAHMLIFFGFLAIQPHSLMLMIQGVFPGFEVSHWMPGIYGGYLFVADILAVLVLAGLAYAVYRRAVVRPGYLTMGPDANLIIVFTAVIVISFHLLNAFLTLLPAARASFTYAGVFPVSEWMVTLFNLKALSPAGVRIGYEISYGIHIATILGFLVYIPGSKHLHLLAAVPNVFLKRLDHPKAIAKTDLENEAAETFGLGRVSELNWKNVLNLYACTECGRCEEQCPASTTDKPLSPKNVIHDFKADLLAQADAVMSRNFDMVAPIVREGSPVNGDVIWSCTTCRACEDICPVNIEQLDFLVETRKHLVLMESSFPPEMQETFTSLENQFNPWGFSSDSRADWSKGLDVPLMADSPDADLLYFVGCSGSFDDRGKKIAQAMARVLLKAGIKFAILGPEESCNGDPARRAGNEYIAQMLIQQNVEVLNRYRPKKILTGCPHCYNIIKNEYPQFGADFEVVHHTQFLLELFQQGRLKTANRPVADLTYHDSCYLGRWNGIYRAPRDLLTLIHGARPIEMPRSGSIGFCCGAGGARMFMEETIGKRINIERAEEIIASGARTAAAACPFCATMLRDGLMDKEADVPVKDIVEIIDEAIA